MKERDAGKETAQIAERDHKAEIVDRLYDVAIDPIRLEELLDVWEVRLAPLRVGPVESAITLVDEEIEQHLQRATVFLDRYEATREAAGYRSILEDIPRSAAFLSDGGAKIGSCNRAAQIAFGIKDGAPTANLPFEPDDIETLRGVVRSVASGKAEKVVTLRIRSLITSSPVIMRVSPVESDAPQPLALVLSTELVWPEGFEVTV